ncbi:MAG: TrkH family potassium uptake protein [Gammaproteobacteria bacterium]|nr:TrkH family potassium uptake protein [Gammaproteobacteria bacterium]MDH4311357.1 TrkH family potassium uptake protein [Gammaproteobacteria bacterium]MDH5274092.1 TrkH family potassium uptake protein [Gammaproteobacteria bacterium]
MLAVINVLGSMLMLFSVTYVLPMVTSVIYRDGMLLDFVYAAVICVTAGAAMFVLTMRHKRELRSRDGFLLVTLAWVFMSAIATVPLMIGLPGLSFTDAFFETMSGLSTTGATVLTGLDSMAPSLNMWRAALHWYGGMGIIVLAVAILPLLGVGGMQLYKAETPGPVKNEKLTPRITQTAKALWVVYLLLTILCVLSLRVAGMEWYDAVFHSFSTLSLGGFSNYDGSVGHYDSVAIELVLVFFMLVSALNFSRHFIAWQQKSLRTYLTDVEASGMLRLVATAVLVVTLYIWAHGVYPDFLTSLRYVTFNLVAMATTCGFVTQDYAAWPAFAPMVIVMLSCYTCNTGSTGGGIKMFRTLVLTQQATRELFLLVHPQAVTPVKIRNQVVSNHIVFAVLAFVVLYFGTVVTLTFLLLASGMDFISSFTAIIATINNAGPGLGVVGPSSNYQGLTDFQTWVCSLAMLLGRLEIFSVLVLLTPTFWRK